MRFKKKMDQRSRTLRTIASYPTGVALAGAVNGVAGAVVGAEANLSTALAVPAIWTHCNTGQITYLFSEGFCHLSVDLGSLKVEFTLLPLEGNMLFESTCNELICLNKRRSQSLPPVAQLPYFHPLEWNE